MAETLRKHSRMDWTVEGNPYPGDWTIVLGCLQRIADATEKMASNYTQLQTDKDWYQKRCESLSQEVEHLKNSRAGHKAALTKIKKKVNEVDE